MSTRTAAGFGATCAMLALLTSAAAATTITVIPAHDHPFTALPSPDGNTIFVSVLRERGPNGILVIHRRDTSYTSGVFIAVDGDPTGLALTPDGHTLLVAAGSRYAAFSAVAAENDATPPVSYLGGRTANGAIEVLATLDGKSAFFTDEVDDSIAMVDISVASDGNPALSFRSRIQTDRAPVGMALSPDGRRLFVTSEVAPGRYADCPVGPYAGSIKVIDVKAAATTPDRATLATATAGCQSVRIVLSPDGATAWVTLRAENSLAAFDTAKLVGDPGHALLRKVTVGTAPVGLALARDGKLAFVANSNRFDPTAMNSTVVAVDTVAALAGANAIVGTYATGAFPREIREAPQHDVVYVTNYNGGTVEAIPIP